MMCTVHRLWIRSWTCFCESLFEVGHRKRLFFQVLLWCWVRQICSFLTMSHLFYHIARFSDLEWIHLTPHLKSFLSVQRLRSDPELRGPTRQTMPAEASSVEPSRSWLHWYRRSCLPMYWTRHFHWRSVFLWTSLPGLPSTEWKSLGSYELYFDRWTHLERTSPSFSPPLAELEADWTLLLPCFLYR